MDYFPPKTKIDFHFGPPRKGRARLGWFVIEEINNQYNNHHYWVWLALDDENKYYYVMYHNQDKNEGEGEGYTSEEEAAEALDAFVASFKLHLLQKAALDQGRELEHLDKAIVECKAICNTRRKQS